MSYLKYLKLYTKNEHNKGGFAKRGKTNNYWVHSSRLNDKVDVFDGAIDKC